MELLRPFLRCQYQHSDQDLLLLNLQEIFLNKEFYSGNNFIKYKDLNQLQINLVRSHASGIGDPMSAGLVRTILFLKILTYIKGFSGIRYKVIDILIKFLNHFID